MSDAERLIAVDVGNSRAKLGLFERPTNCQRAALAGPLPIASGVLPEPVGCIEWDHAPGGTSYPDGLKSWVHDHPARRALVASVHKAAGDKVHALLAESGVGEVIPLTGDALPIETHVERRDRVGVDRLLGAVAANRLRHDATPAIVIDVGTAITIDLVAEDGAFEGGAILPGIRMASTALHQHTDALPDIAMDRLEASPDAVGRSTDAAVRAGLFWGAVGAVREIVARQRDRLTKPPQIFLTGGAAPSIARLLAEPDCTVRYLPHLVLAGVAIVDEVPGGSGA